VSHKSSLSIGYLVLTLGGNAAYSSPTYSNQNWIGKGRNVSAIKDLHYTWCSKILSKLHKPLGVCNLKEFSNITSSVNPSLLKLSYDYTFII